MTIQNLSSYNFHLFALALHFGAQKLSLILYYIYIPFNLSTSAFCYFSSSLFSLLLSHLNTFQVVYFPYRCGTHRGIQGSRCNWLKQDTARRSLPTFLILSLQSLAWILFTTEWSLCAYKMSFPYLIKKNCIYFAHVTM